MRPAFIPTYKHVRFAFDVPEGFHVLNGERQVLLQGPNGAAIIFDRSPKPFDGPPAEYIGAPVRLASARRVRVCDIGRIRI